MFFFWRSLWIYYVPAFNYWHFSKCISCFVLKFTNHTFLFIKRTLNFPLMLGEDELSSHSTWKNVRESSVFEFLVYRLSVWTVPLETRKTLHYQIFWATVWRIPEEVNLSAIVSFWDLLRMKNSYDPTLSCDVPHGWPCKLYCGSLIWDVELVLVVCALWNKFSLVCYTFLGAWSPFWCDTFKCSPSSVGVLALRQLNNIIVLC